jgi:hypothetical protein
MQSVVGTVVPLILFRKMLKPVEQVLKDAKLKKSEIDDIVLIVVPPVFQLFRR